MQKTALVLAGGGARGAYQIGVWQALKEMDIKIDIVTGTSVGSLNAAFVAMDDWDSALKLWLNINTSMVFDVNLDESLPAQQKITTMVKNFLRDYAMQGGTNAYPLKKLLDESIDEDLIRESPIECGIVVFDKSSLKPLELYVEDINQGQLTEYLLASSSLYPAIKSCKIDGVEYVDGGYYDNLPIELALRKGAENVIAIDLEAIGIVRKDTLKLAKNLKIIKCYWDLGPLLVFDNEIIKRDIRLGYLDGMKAYGAFDGRAYTFIKGSISRFIKQQKENIDIQNSALNFKDTKSGFLPITDLFYLNIAATLKKKHGKNFTLNWLSFFTSCMEIAGEVFEISPEKIYTVEKFNERILQKIQQIEAEISSPVTVNKLNATLKLLNPKNRAIYLGTLIKKAIVEGKMSDLLGFTFLLPEDIMAGYYLALIA